jgi:hypothetical protein
MWIFTPFGFFSIVQRRGDKTLTVRARAKGDLDLLRESYLPSLSPTVATPKADYPHRATVNHQSLATALGRLARNIDYPNFKDEVRRVQGDDREQVYERVWSVVREVTALEKRRPVIVPVGETPTPGRGRIPLYSVRGSGPQSPATRATRKALPLPVRRTTVLLDRQLSAKDLGRVALGFVPKSMDDKWFIFLEGDQLFCHRSWTGYCVYVFRLAPGRRGAGVTSVEVNRSPKQFRGGSDAIEAAKACRLLESLLLRKSRSLRQDAPDVILKDWGYTFGTTAKPGRRGSAKRGSHALPRGGRQTASKGR